MHLNSESWIVKFLYVLLIFSIAIIFIISTASAVKLYRDEERTELKDTYFKCNVGKSILSVIGIVLGIVLAFFTKSPPAAPIMFDMDDDLMYQRNKDILNNDIYNNDTDVLLDGSTRKRKIHPPKGNSNSIYAGPN